MCENLIEGQFDIAKVGNNDLKMAPSANETEFITKESLPKSRIEGF